MAWLLLVCINCVEVNRGFLRYPSSRLLCEHGLLVRQVRRLRYRGIRVLTLIRWPLFHPDLSISVLKLDGLGWEDPSLLGINYLIIQERVFLCLCGTL